MIVFKAGVIICLTLVIEFVIQQKQPSYTSDPLITSLALVVIRGALGVGVALNWARYLGMWRRASGRSAPWRAAAFVFAPAVIIGTTLSSQFRMLATSVWLLILSAVMWSAVAWAVRDVSEAIDAYYAANTSFAARLERGVARLPQGLSTRADMVGLDIGTILLSAFLWYVMKETFKMG